MPAPVPAPARLVVLVSGSGTNLQALLDACADPAYGARVVAVGADRDGIEGLARADRAGIPTFTRSVSDFETRDGWDAALATVVPFGVARHEGVVPDGQLWLPPLVVVGVVALTLAAARGAVARVPVVR